MNPITDKKVRSSGLRRMETVLVLLLLALCWVCSSHAQNGRSTVGPASPADLVPAPIDGVSPPADQANPSRAGHIGPSITPVQTDRPQAQGPGVLPNMKAFAEWLFDVSKPANQEAFNTKSAEFYRELIQNRSNFERATDEAGAKKAAQDLKDLFLRNSRRGNSLHIPDVASAICINRPALDLTKMGALSTVFGGDQGVKFDGAHVAGAQGTAAGVKVSQAGADDKIPAPTDATATRTELASITSPIRLSSSPTPASTGNASPIRPGGSTSSETPVLSQNGCDQNGGNPPGPAPSPSPSPDPGHDGGGDGDGDGDFEDGVVPHDGSSPNRMPMMPFMGGLGYMGQPQVGIPEPQPVPIMYMGQLPPLFIPPAPMTPVINTKVPMSVWDPADSDRFFAELGAEQLSWRTMIFQRGLAFQASLYAYVQRAFPYPRSGFLQPQPMNYPSLLTQNQDATTQTGQGGDAKGATTRNGDASDAIGD